MDTFQIHNTHNTSQPEAIAVKHHVSSLDFSFGSKPAPSYSYLMEVLHPQQHGVQSIIILC